MGVSKTDIAKRMGLDIAPPEHLPQTTGDSCVSKNRTLMRNERPEGIGKEIQRRAAYGKVTPESIAQFLHHYRECGIIVKAALAANLSYSTIAALRKNDPEFAEEMEQAKQLWIAEKLDEPLREIGITGLMKPIFNQKTGQLLGHERVVHAQVTLAYARKFDSAYRDKQEVDVNHSGGVLVVTAPAQSADDWKSRFGSGTKHEVIDVPAKSLPASPDQENPA